MSQFQGDIGVKSAIGQGSDFCFFFELEEEEVLINKIDEVSDILETDSNLQEKIFPNENFKATIYERTPKPGKTVNYSHLTKKSNSSPEKSNQETVSD